MSVIVNIGKNILLSLWAVVGLLSLIFGILGADLAGIGLAGLTGLWLWFWISESKIEDWEDWSL